MKKLLHIFGILTLFLATVSAALAQESTPQYKSEEVVVTASRMPSSLLSATRYVTVVDSSEIATLPVESIQGVLQFVTGTDLKQRGAMGVQADVSIRGATFDQTLILVDGVKMNDPQTGHHSFSIPVPLSEVARVEVLHGHGSSLYGPNAFGGVINIITKRSAKTGANLSLTAGEHGFYGGAATLTHTVGKTAHRLGLHKRASTGYRHNTDFDINKISYQGTILIPAAPVNVYAGLTEREFGANDFYSTAFPDQRESVRTTLFRAVSEIQVGELFIVPQFHWRQNSDDFILDNTRPEWYRNRHTTDVYGGEVTAALENRFGRTALGFEYGEESIESSNLGDHSRQRGGIVLEHQAEFLDRINLDLGAFAYYHSGYDWQVYPGIGLGYQVSDLSSAFINLGQAYRVPTFTDLYYTSPANIGNPELEPERSRSYEAGYRWFNQILTGNVAAFYRDGYNLIDWTRNQVDSPWMVQNIRDVNTYGTEIRLTFLIENLRNRTRIPKVELKYAYLNSETENLNAESKYLLNYLRHQLQAGIHLRLPAGIRQSWAVRYNDRAGLDSFTLTDVRTQRTFGNFLLRLDITNLFDASYQEIPGVPMPGRWVRFGIETTVGK